VSSEVVEEVQMVERSRMIDAFGYLDYSEKPPGICSSDLPKLIIESKSINRCIEGSALPIHWEYTEPKFLKIQYPNVT
jgi:hypothetical protein